MWRLQADGSGIKSGKTPLAGPLIALDKDERNKIKVQQTRIITAAGTLFSYYVYLTTKGRACLD